MDLAAEQLPIVVAIPHGEYGPAHVLFGDPFVAKASRLHGVVGLVEMRLDALV